MLIVIDLGLVPFSLKSLRPVHQYGRFSSRCEFHLSTSFQRAKHWLKVSEHILEMLTFMGMLLVSFSSSRDYQSRCHSHLWSKCYFSTFL